MTAYISSTEEMASLTFIVALTISAFNSWQRSLFGLLTSIEGKSCLDTPLYFIKILNIHLLGVSLFYHAFTETITVLTFSFSLGIICDFSFPVQVRV